MMPENFDRLHAEFVRCLDYERELPFLTAYDEDRMGVAVDETMVAWRAMMAEPASGVADCIRKLRGTLAMADGDLSGTQELAAAIEEICDTLVRDAKAFVAAVQAPPEPRALAPEPEPIDNSRLGRFRRSRWAWLEPWYDWGWSGTVGLREDISGDGRHLALEWLGLNLLFVTGRTPKAVRA